MNVAPRLFPALFSSGFSGKEGVFLTQRAQSFTQGVQSGYGGEWCSTTTEVENALWGGAAHREAYGREYHPVNRLAGMRVCGHVREQAYSKIAYGQDCVRKEILRLPCQAALQDSRAGGISMSLDFFGTFLARKKYRRKLYPNRSRLYRPRALPILQHHQHERAPLRPRNCTVLQS